MLSGLCPRWVIRDRCSRTCLPVHVRFGPKATYIRRCREMTRWAKEDVATPRRQRPIATLMPEASRLKLFPFSQQQHPRMPPSAKNALVSNPIEGLLLLPLGAPHGSRSWLAFASDVV